MHQGKLHCSSSNWQCSYDLVNGPVKFIPFLPFTRIFMSCSVHAYIVFKTEESAQSSLSHNMSVVCHLSEIWPISMSLG